MSPYCQWQPLRLTRFEHSSLGLNGTHDVASNSNIRLALYRGGKRRRRREFEGGGWGLEGFIQDRDGGTCAEVVGGGQRRRRRRRR